MSTEEFLGGFFGLLWATAVIMVLCLWLTH